MKYCSKCGAEAEDRSAFCPQCGATFAVNPEPFAQAAPPPNAYENNAYQQTPPPYQQASPPPPNPYQNTYYPPPPNPYPNYTPPPPPPAVNDARSGGFAVLCFFWPLVGLILYLVWHDDRPLRAKSCGKGALIGVIVQVVGVILYVIIIIAIVAAAATSFDPYYDALAPAVSALARLAG
ncbi:MAG: zinc ribbon domain-containing protein [Clostridiales bacterium]|jgi:hypothetical protein|nr:zinc ribbon domain-containing protein [Clostridiales bacterium]